MNVFDKVSILKEDGTLKSMVNAGLVSPKVYLHLEIFIWIEERKKLKKRGDIAFEAMFQFDVSRATIYRIMKTMRGKMSQKCDT